MATKPDLRTLLAIVLCCLTLPAAAWQPTDLMRLLAQDKSGRASFVERKYISIIDQPVESSGTLAFTAPDKLEKRTLKPRPEALILDGDQLTIERAGKAPTTLRISRFPEAAAFVESIRGTLAGDLRALERTYWLKLEGNAGKWLLTLEPRDDNMSATVTRISISGQRSVVQRIEFAMADGDRSEMLITPLP